MNKPPEKPGLNGCSDSLYRYQEAISRLPLDTQIEKMQAIESPHTLRRFLSAGAPMELAHRFGNRLMEVAELLTTYEKGRALYAQSRFGEAEQLFQEAIQEGDPRGHEGLALVYMEDVNRYQEALQHCESAIKAGINDQKTRTMKMVIHFQLGKGLDAFDELDVIKTMPEEKMWQKNTKRLAEACGLIELEHNEEAFAMLQELSRQGNTEATTILANTCLAQAEYEDAMFYMEHAISLGRIELYKKLAHLQSGLGMKKEAAETLERGLKAGALGENGVYDMVALGMAERGNYEYAEQLCDDAIKKGDPYAAYVKAEVATLKKDPEQAAGYVRKAIAAGYKPPFQFAFLTFLNADDYEAAMELGMAEAEKDGTAYFFLKVMYDRMGDEKLANLNLRKGVEATGIHYAYLQIQQKNPAKSLSLARGMISNMVEKHGLPDTMTEDILGHFRAMDLN